MRIRLGLLTMAAAALGVCASATAGGVPIPENQYEGKLENRAASYFGFDVVRRGDTKRVAKIHVITPFRCDNDSSGMVSFPVRGTFPVEGKSFGGRVEYNARGIPFKVRVEGTLRKRGRATGTFKYVARPPAVDIRQARGAEDRSVCRFREQKWSAKRGREVEPEPIGPPAPRG